RRRTRSTQASRSASPARLRPRTAYQASSGPRSSQPRPPATATTRSARMPRIGFFRPACPCPIPPPCPRALSNRSADYRPGATTEARATGRGTGGPLVPRPARSLQHRDLEVHAVQAGEVAAPVEAVLVGNGHQLAHAAGLADQRRHLL